MVVSFVFECSPLLGEDEPILTHILSPGLVQPPTTVVSHAMQNAGGCSPLHQLHGGHHGGDHLVERVPGGGGNR